MSDFDIVAAFFAILGFLSVLAGLIVAVNLVITHVRDKRRARTHHDAERQERDARRRLRVRTTDVTGLAPVVTIDGRPVLGVVHTAPEIDGDQAA